MGMLNVYVIMALLGFAAFVFIAESINPFRRHIIESLKVRHRVGAIAGLLIALSSLIVLVMPTAPLLPQVKLSLATSFFLLLPLVIYMLVKQLLSNRAIKKHGSRAAQRHSTTDGSAGRHDKAQLNLATEQNRTSTNTATDPDRQTASAATAVTAAITASSVNADSDKTAQGQVVPDTASSNSDDAKLLQARREIEQRKMASRSSNQTDKEASRSAETHDALSDLDDAELQRSLTDQAPTPDLDDLTIGNSFPFTARVAEDAQNAANAEFLQESSNTFPAPDTHDSSIIADDLVDDIVEWHAIEEDAPEDVDHVVTKETIHPAPTTVGHGEPMEQKDDEISRLEAAMDSVTHQADAIQTSISRIQDLNAEESRYREQLQHAQIAYDNAHRLQIEQQRSLIDSSEKQLADESKQRNDAENELARKRREFVDMQVRVEDLETELRERQQVFADQVSSLKKTREMARHAAHLARRAALAQQRARAQALQERAAREKLEVSAKKAVDIARNAISKLAEEERKNKQITH